jgi:hypothetical protein
MGCWTVFVQHTSVFEPIEKTQAFKAVLFQERLFVFTFLEE